MKDRDRYLRAIKQITQLLDQMHSETIEPLKSLSQHDPWSVPAVMLILQAVVRAQRYQQTVNLLLERLTAVLQDVLSQGHELN